MTSDTALQTRPLTLRDCCEGLPGSAEASGDGPALISRLLHEQRQLSAVEVFSRDHDQGDVPALARYYSKLLPAAPPGPGQQYAFEVDLDRCSGCKACVTACHSLNGLDAGETWRDVGLLLGGTESTPVMQHVTATCHHCLQPACLIACPVNAYEKDPQTGIVRHLDDQCFGCQYCTLACPYDVPKYHAQKGIVRKCDMCSGRLAQREAPACVQSCPHEAISIRVVEVSKVLEDAEADNFLPAAPEPYLTFPTTSYKTRRVYPRNMLPADYYSVSPQHPHWPLIVMLVLTQLSVGAFTTGGILEQSLAASSAAFFHPLQATGALVSGLLALAASTFHLGRPQYAFRGIIGLRHSWLSREILAFGLFAGLAIPYAAACWFASPAGADWQPWSAVARSALPALGLVVAGTGLLGVFCSAMIYAFTRRELWSIERTLGRFLMTAALLGIATTWLSILLLGWLVHPAAAEQLLAGLCRPLACAMLIAASVKLLFDLLLLRHLADFRKSPLKRSALLLTGPLSNYALARMATGIFGGVAMPLALLSHSAARPLSISDPIVLLVVGMMWTGTLAGEMLERYLFFAAVSAPRMPGGMRP